MRNKTTSICILYKIIFTVIILCVSINAYADADSGAGYKGILLFDSDRSHSILGDVYENNILNISDFQYSIHIRENPTIRTLMESS